MGCGASSRVVPVVDVDSGDWNASYERLTQHGVQLRQQTQSTNFDLGEQAASVKYNKDNRLAEINGYSISRPLGKGAFGEVFLGKKSGVTFAIKAMKQETIKKTRSLGGRPGAGGGQAAAAARPRSSR